MHATRVVRKLAFCYSAQHPVSKFAMIRCHLSTLMGRDKLRISDVSRLTGLNRSTVTSLYKEKGYLFSSSDVRIAGWKPRC